MLAAIESLKVRFIVRLGWADEGRLLEAVRGFQATEADGVWHLHRGLQGIADPKHRAIVFTHSLEEESHADAFAEVYRQSSARALQPVRYERSSLYSAGDPGWKSFAYVHVGEVDATARFKLIQRSLADGPLRRALARIVDDEEGHIDLTHDILLQMGARALEIRREVRRVRARRAWERWLRAGQRVVDGIVTVQLSLIYYLVGPLLFTAARKKLGASLVAFDNNHLKAAVGGALALPAAAEARPARVLGVSYGYHDASATLVIGGTIVAAIAEERLTRQKHDANFPTHAIERCLAAAGLVAADLDAVVYHEDPHTKFSRVLTSSLAPFPGSRREFVNSVKAWVGGKLWSLGQIASRLQIAPDRLRYLGHHTSHAVQAFMGSGFEEAAILVVDAVGDWSSTALFKGRWVDGVPEVERLCEIAFPHSIGLVYSAFTAYFGFNPNDSECSTMALAGFGEPRFVADLEEILGPLDGDTYRVDVSYFNFSAFYRGAVTERFIARFGPPRDPRAPLPFDCLGAADPSTWSADDRRIADLAASLQRVTEERILALARRLHERFPSDNLCYAGGVSLNCVANGRLLTESPFRRIHVPIDPGDGGTSVGTALYVSARHGGLAPADLRHGPYLGAAYDESADVAMIEHLRPDYFLDYLKRGVGRPPGTRWAHRTFEDDAALCEAVAARLLDRKIVGWFQGKFEFGPRALGNRSILIRPDDRILAQRLSKLVKERAAYRPYAFSIAEEDAPALLDVDPDHLCALRWMQFTVRVRPEALAQVRAATHVDGSTRVQVVHADDNPLYHRLLRSFGAAGFGPAVVLNTSFNPSGYPIVSTPAEALSMFARTDMDILVLGKTMIWEER